MKRILVAAMLSIVLALAGCASNGHNSLGLKTMPECDSDQTLSDSGIMHCYGAAAITYAYAGDTANATGTCEEIWRKFGESIPPDAKDDMRDKAAMVSNSCYQNVAVILADPNICYNIKKKSGPDTQLSGEKTSLELCIKQAEQQFKLREYYNNPTNLCSMVLILPLLLFAAFWKR